MSARPHEFPGLAFGENWGLLDARAWLGRTLAARGDAHGAREQYEIALDLEPEYSFVRYALLPNIDQ